MEALGLTAKTETDLTRTSFIEGAPFTLITTAFETPVNSAAMIETPEIVALLEVIDISPPDRSSQDLSAALERLNDRASASLAADVFELYGQAVQSRHGLQLDQAAINAVHQQFAGGIGGQ